MYSQHKKALRNFGHTKFHKEAYSLSLARHAKTNHSTEIFLKINALGWFKPNVKINTKIMFMFPPRSFFLWRYSPTWALAATDTHTHTHNMSPLNELSACHKGRYPHNTQQTQETNIHALSGIRSLNPSIQTAAELSLRPHSDRYRPHYCLHDITFLYFYLCDTITDMFPLLMCNVSGNKIVDLKLVSVIFGLTES